VPATKPAKKVVPSEEEDEDAEESSSLADSTDSEFVERQKRKYGGAGRSPTAAPAKRGADRGAATGSSSKPAANPASQARRGRGGGPQKDVGDGAADEARDRRAAEAVERAGLLSKRRGADEAGDAELASSTPRVVQLCKRVRAWGDSDVAVAKRRGADRFAVVLPGELSVGPERVDPSARVGTFSVRGGVPRLRWLAADAARCV